MARGLGRGLDALIPAGANGTTGAGTVLRELRVADIVANPHQPRRHFDEGSLASLAASVGELGVLQPVLVREVSGGGSFELIAGERRWRAAQRAGLETIPALVRTADDVTSLEQAVVENLHRQDLTPLEEAGAYAQLLEDFGYTHEQLARRVGKSRAAVTNALRLFQLPAPVQRQVAEGRLSAGHARALLGADDPAYQEALGRRTEVEGLSVRAVEEAVRARAEDGDRRRPRRPPPSASSRPAGMVELEALLSEHLSTHVVVEERAGRNRVVIEFADLDDLERVYKVMLGATT